MRTIKPGKLVSSVTKDKSSKSGNSKSSSSSSISSKIKVWEDFAPAGSKKKKEYTPSSDGRMIEKKKDISKDRHESRDFREQDSKNFRRPSEDYAVLEEKFKYKFKESQLLKSALTHRSALGIKERSDYERLEFLGDAVLDLCVAHLLSDRHPEAREGDLSKMRAALVNTQALAEIGTRLEISSFIKLGRGENTAEGAERPSILADVMEAIIGAIYRDSGFDTVLKLAEDLFGNSLDVVTPYDPKTELQEKLHKAGSEPLGYLLELVEGPEHSPIFVSVVIVDNEVAGRGKGATKKASQQAAAAVALIRAEFDDAELRLKEGQEDIISEALMLKEAA